jgi:hypothetical protein
MTQAQGEPVACASSSIGLDPSYTTGHDGPDSGEAAGQVFLARDTLIQSISVWRYIPPDTNYFGLKLYITRADGSGRPNIAGLLLSGPTIVHPTSPDGLPIKYQWIFDPPFALPSQGYYWFGVQPDPCYGFFQILLNGANAYKDGDSWLTGRVPLGECYLKPYPTHFPNVDLVFEIRFCSAATAVLPDSWGHLKLRYH